MAGKGAQYKVLVVDDSRLMHQVYKSAFIDRDDISLLFAKNGADAIDMLAFEDKIDLILLDIHMPKMGGIEFIEKVKSKVGQRDIPIIVTSTEGEEKYTQKALKLGAEGYLVKPFKMEYLYKLVDKILS